MYAHLLINKNNVRLTFVTVIYLFCCVYVLYEERCPWTNFFLLSGVLQMNLRWILTLHLIYIKMVCPSNWKNGTFNKQTKPWKKKCDCTINCFFFCIVLLLHEFILMIFEMVDRMLLSFFMNKDCCLLSIFHGPIYKVV